MTDLEATSFYSFEIQRSAKPGSSPKAMVHDAGKETVMELGVERSVIIQSEYSVSGELEVARELGDIAEAVLTDMPEPAG